MKMKKFGGTERKVLDIVAPIIADNGYTLWDVSYEKEGAYYYLRIFADRPDGMTIEDCEKLTAPIDEALEEADPIQGAYILEVGSAGLERRLNQPEHFTATIGMLVRARSIRPVNGEREWIGTLESFLPETQQISIALQETGDAVTLNLADLSYVQRYLEV